MMKVHPLKEISQINRIRRNLKEKKTAVMYALFVLGVNTNLRVSDLLNLRWSNVWLDDTHEFREKIELTEQKTGKHRRIQITENISEALTYLLANIREPEADDHIIRNPVTRVRYSREHLSRFLALEVKKVGFQDSFGIHGLRATWGFHAVVTFRQPLALVQTAFNHSSQRQTMDYLGITDEQLTEVYEAVAL